MRIARSFRTAFALTTAWLVFVTTINAAPLFSDSFAEDSSERYSDLDSKGALTVSNGTWTLANTSGTEKPVVRSLPELQLDAAPGYVVSFTLGKVSEKGFAVWLHAAGQKWFDLEGVRIQFEENDLEVKSRQRRGRWHKTSNAVYEGARRAGAKVKLGVVGGRAVEVSIDGRLQGKFLLDSYFSQGKTASRKGSIAIETAGKLALTSLRVTAYAEETPVGFSFAETYPVLEDPYLVVADDLDDDGIKDLVVANRGEITKEPPRPVDQVSVLFGKKDGTYEAARHLKVGQSPYTVQVADANADGQKDILVACFFDWTGRDLAVLLGKKNREFETASYIALPKRDPLFPKGDKWPVPGSTSLVARDFNGDGNVDIAATGWTCDTVYVLLGEGDGSFHMNDAHQHQDYGYGFRDIKSADLDGDGKLDLALTGYLSHTVALFQGQGDGTFTFVRRYGSFGQNPYHLALGDIDNDKDLDIVVGNVDGNVRALIHWKGWDFENGGTYSQFGAAQSETNQIRDVLIRDIDGDGFQDLVLACADNRSGFVSVAFGSGKFNRGHYFARSQQYYLGKNPRSVVVEDLNGDGGTDMAVVRLGANDVTILRGVAK